MLTELTIRNFKRFGDVQVALGNPVILIGPNNSGKSSALQALALWDLGLRRWNEKRGGEKTPERRPGVVINRRDLISLPVPSAKLLWKDLHTHDSQRVGGKPNTQNVRVEILVEGVTGDKHWKCGLEFDYANQESLYCRPLRLEQANNPSRMGIPPEASSISVAFLPPMSGLAANETRLDSGAINVRIGEGRTAEVLRNLCNAITEAPGGDEQWEELSEQIKDLFGVELEQPTYVEERGEITMFYRERGVRLDLSCSGRGLQQTLLLLAYLYANPGSVLLLDEPDAHLEILRQRQIYQLLTDVAGKQGSQIIAASHSEVLLNEAANRDVVVAFVGKPHRIDDRGSQVLKALKQIGFEQYYQAEQTGWVLYLEGSTDLAILHRFAQRMGHPAGDLLERPFVHYVQNQPQQARNHFHGLREAKTDLVGFALFDRLDEKPRPNPDLVEYQWHRNEIENYLCQPETLLAFAEDSAPKGSAGPLFEDPDVARWRSLMQECINDFVPGVALRDRSDRWWVDTKASDVFLDRVFESFYERLGLPNLLRKTGYHVLAEFVPEDQMDSELREVLGMIVDVSRRAKPLAEEPAQ
ncbi:MAG: AAA family ATPase [Phycisphaerae bacterium]|nr:AAA family ATPase [Phycisphaerae bacterium]